VLFTLAILGLLVLVTGYLVVARRVALSLGFFTELPDGACRGAGGMKHAIIGTGILAAWRASSGIPRGMAGVYLAEYDAGSWLATPVRFIADVLAGVPSIVVGILGYELLVVPLGHSTAGPGRWRWRSS
jgi:phosphate transport system permease protein